MSQPYPPQQPNDPGHEWQVPPTLPPPSWGGALEPWQGGYDQQPWAGAQYANPAAGPQHPASPYAAQQPFGTPQPYAAQQPFGSPQPFAPHPYPVAQTQKSRVAAAVLAFFLGTLGIHNFYTGYVGAGLAQLLLTLAGWATSWLFIGFFLIIPVSIWAFVEMILFLAAGTGRYSRSADGVPLS